MEIEPHTIILCFAKIKIDVSGRGPRDMSSECCVDWATKILTRICRDRLWAAWLALFYKNGNRRWAVRRIVGMLIVGAWFINATCGSAMVFGEDDRRQQSYHDMYHLKSVGVVVAGSYVGVGTLVLRGDVMVTSAHVIYDELGSLRSSQVTYFPDGNWEKRVSVDLTKAVAGNTVVKPGKLQDDWIILNLAKDVIKENPHQGFSSAGILPVTPRNFSKLKDNIVHVSFDFRRRPHRKLVNRKCRLHQKVPGDMFWDIPSILLHDCDLGRRDNSGSPIFYFDDGKYYLIGLHQGGHRDVHDSIFDPAKNPNFAYGITHQFERAISRVMGMQSIDVPER